jgi:hypothetical protein
MDAGGEITNAGDEIDYALYLAERIGMCAPPAALTPLRTAADRGADGEAPRSSFRSSATLNPFPPDGEAPRSSFRSEGAGCGGHGGHGWQGSGWATGFDGTRWGP